MSVAQRQLLLAQALNTLSTSRVGMAEASVLLVINGETTYRQIIEALGLPSRAAWSRISVLKRKDLVDTKHRTNGAIYHVLTRRGRELVNELLGV